MLFKVEIYTHFIKVSHIDHSMIPYIYRFCLNYAFYKWTKKNNKSIKTVSKIYATRTHDDSEYRFHRAFYNEFIDMLNREHIKPHLYQVVEHNLYPVHQVDIKLRPHFILRDYQQPIHDFIISEIKDDYNTRLVTIQTGKGKGVISLSAACTINGRVVVIVLARYVKKWLIEIEEKVNVDKKDIAIIQGASNLKTCINLALDDNLQSKFIIISLKTLNGFYRIYEEYPKGIQDAGYLCKPDELFKVLGAGTIIIDEVHQHLHAVYKTMLYMHIGKLIALTATMIFDDYFLKKLTFAIFPKHIRYDNLEIDKYIKCYSISYVFENIRASGVRTTELRSNMYSHNAFEKSILRNRKLLMNYDNMINYLIDIGYFQYKQSGDKLVIFVSLVDYATHLTKFLQNLYPYLDIRRYVKEDPYENLIEPDIRVTTILSAGTAMDIPGLICNIMTTNIKSSISNLQTLGRLRDTKGKTVRFYYVYCAQINKHVEYKEHRVKLLTNYVQSIKEFNYPTAL